MILRLLPFIKAPPHSLNAAEPKCPTTCLCSYDYNEDYSFFCSSRNPSRIPDLLPKNARDLWPYLQQVHLGHYKSLTCSWASNLRRLFLQHKDITPIDDNSFSDIQDLLELDLRFNKLSQLSARSFTGLKNLSDLLLAKNLLQTLSSETFSPFQKLQWLDLSDNQLTIRVFKDLQFLEELNLSYNKLRTLVERVFEGLGQLEFLSLNNNNIQEIRPGAFTGLFSMAVMNLSGNCFRTLYDHSFRGLEKLHSLHVRLFLQRNTVIDDNSFSDIQDLLELDLRFNKLSQLSARSFTGLKNLSDLLLAKNLLQTLSSETFSPFQKLQWLDLSDNQLTILWLLRNHWDCSCSLKDLRDFCLKNATIVPRVVQSVSEGYDTSPPSYIYNNVTCATPSQVVGKDLRDLNDERFAQCP
ncbi:hypothetical protein GDO78_018038 [Eleutherodactylus coqui]|uniref:Uncharacterized protein n=1 Tax=Eleutherodactylus coqui TaxID=57060 RepID=A0A8J6E9P8_ELECQ|nr:hypothetical protein GDO78_018038 [Eleutherodactylus coqui]